MIDLLSGVIIVSIFFVLVFVMLILIGGLSLVITIFSTITTLLIMIITSPFALISYLKGLLWKKSI